MIALNSNSVNDSFKIFLILTLSTIWKNKEQRNSWMLIVLSLDLIDHFVDPGIGEKGSLSITVISGCFSHDTRVSGSKVLHLAIFSD